MPWTLLVYMAADNDLAGEAEHDLQQMKSTPAVEAVNVVVQLDREDPRFATRRYRLRHGSSLVSDTVETLGETNSGAPEVLEDFLAWGIANYPAERVMVVLWSHGDGVNDQPLSPAAGPHGMGMPAGRKPPRSFFRVPRVQEILLPGRLKIGVDLEAGDFLDNLELKKVFEKIAHQRGRPVDVLGMDACLMSLVEVAWQLREGVCFLVASQDNEPGAGWPYDAILADLAAKPQSDAREVSQMLVERYLGSFAGHPAVTLAACEIGKLSAVVTALESLATVLHGGLVKASFEAAVRRARDAAREFANADYVDLHHLCGCLTAELPELSVPCRKVQAALGKAVLEQVAPAEASNAHGLSIYFPKLIHLAVYGRLDLARGSAWLRFLAALVPPQSSPV